MASTNSDQIDLQTVLGNQYAEGNRDLNAKLRIEYFSELSTAAAADTIVVARLPKGARIIGGQLVGQANTASSTMSVGTDQALSTGSGGAVTIAAGAANLLAATSTAAAYNLALAATFALGAGALTTAPTNVYITVAGATLTGTAHVTGWIIYTAN